MKTLIEKSIYPIGFGMPHEPNIFSDPNLIGALSFADISVKPGETLPVIFAYKEGKQTKTSRIQFTYPTGKTQEELKTLIIDAINNSLNS